MLDEQNIKKYLIGLDPNVFGFVNDSIVTKVEKLGLGESNLTYLVVINGKRFNLRINMDPSSPTKLEDEYLALNLVEKLGIAPKAYHYEPPLNSLGEAVIILDYINGTSLVNMEIGSDIIVLLAKTVARLHSTPTTEIIRQQLKKKGFEEILQETKAYFDELTKKRNNRSDSLEITLKLSSTYLEICNANRNTSATELVLGHGDIDPSNVILHEEEMRLIDWESLAMIDPALEIASIFDSFDLIAEHQELFMQEYLKIKNESSLRKRVKMAYPVQIFSCFCWALMHVFEIKNAEFHEYFINEQNLEEHVDYAKKMFDKCRKAGLIDENVQWDGEKIFSLVD